MRPPSSVAASCLDYARAQPPPVRARRDVRRLRDRGSRGPGRHGRRVRSPAPRRGGILEASGTEGALAAPQSDPGVVALLFVGALAARWSIRMSFTCSTRQWLRPDLVWSMNGCTLAQVASTGAQRPQVWRLSRDTARPRAASWPHDGTREHGAPRNRHRDSVPNLHGGFEGRVRCRFRDRQRAVAHRRRGLLRGHRRRPSAERIARTHDGPPLRQWAWGVTAYRFERKSAFGEARPRHSGHPARRAARLDVPELRRTMSWSPRVSRKILARDPPAARKSPRSSRAPRGGSRRSTTRTSPLGFSP